MLVVDQNDDERIAPILEAFEGRLRLEHLRSARGISRACNVGFARCTADIVGRPDDDCWYAPDTIATVMHAFAEHPEWAALSGMSCDAAGRPTQLRWNTDAGLVSPRNLWRRAIGFTFFIRGAAIATVGEWDESYSTRVGPDGTLILGGGQDGEYILRALSRGLTVGYEPSIRVGHPDFRPSVRDGEATRKAYAYGLDHTRLLKQYNFPAWFILWRAGQLAAGTVYFLLRGELGRARFYGAMARGRLRGVTAKPRSERPSR